MHLNNFFELKSERILQEVRGVVAIVEDISGNLLLVLENESKPWKRSGQRSVMMETKKNNETFMQCVHRGLKEELNLKEEDIIDLYFDINDKTVFVRERNGWIRISLKLFKVKVGNFDIKFSNGEIRKIKLVSSKEIISELVKQNGNLYEYISTYWRPFTLEVILRFCRGIEIPERILIEDGKYMKGYFATLEKIIRSLNEK